MHATENLNSIEFKPLYLLNHTVVLTTSVKYVNI